MNAELELTPIAVGPETSAFEHMLVVLVLVGLAGHLLALLVTFVLHYYDTATRGARPPSSLATYASAFLGEWWFSLAYMVSFLPGYVPGKRLAPLRPGGGPPVLLVHGYLLNRACMFAIYWRLRRQGFHHVYTVNLRPTFGPIQEIADNLIPRVREIAAHHGRRPVHVVAHSMGGLVARKCLQRDPELPVASVVTLGGPHQGTYLAAFAISPAARELRPGSTFLDTLPADAPVPFTSIYSLVDNMVLPPESAVFGQRAIQFTDVGHVGLMYSRRVFEAIAAELPVDGEIDHRRSA